MDIIPLITIKDGKLYNGKDGELLSIDDLFKELEKDAMLYVLDLDGVTKDNANLDVYQELTEHCTLWIDAGPRLIDDVMDMIMAGATNLTIRTEHWPDVDLPGIFELTEDDIFLANTQGQRDQIKELLRINEGIGIVIFTDEKQVDDSIEYGASFIELAKKHKIYLYNVLPPNVTYWSERGVNGVLVDIQKKKEYI